jgi:hypothetical protein
VKGLTVSLRIVMMFVVALIVAAVLVTIGDEFVGGKLSGVMNEVFSGGLMISAIYFLRGVDI